MRSMHYVENFINSNGDNGHNCQFCLYHLFRLDQFRSHSFVLGIQRVRCTEEDILFFLVYDGFNGSVRKANSLLNHCVR